MFWHRVQEPTGTTNMDFEFNQNKCEQDVNDVDKDGNTTEPTPDSVCSANGITPVRKANDVLIQYDLASGGTRPELFLSRWVASGNKSQCQAANSTPCWGTRFNLSTANDATGSINNAAITDADNTPVDETDGLATGGTISPRTFGEASVDFDALVTGGGCTTFGSVYLKSRSSDSFTAALKDFIAPRATNVSNCGSVKIIKTDDANNNLDGAVFTVYKDVAPTGVSPGTEDTTQANTVGTCTTSAGTCTVSNLLAGSYWVVETTAPSGYDKATPDYQLVSITSDQQATVTFVNPRQKGTISIHKQDDGDPAASLAGAVFTLYHNNPPLTAPRGNAQEDPAVSPAVTCTTDASGNCSMQNVPVGEYWVVETTTPQGHQTAADQRATVTGGQTLSLTFTNPRLFKTIVLVCRESDNSLYSSSVTIDGVTKNSLDTHANETTLCQLGGASFGGQLKGNHTGSVVIPTSELPQP
jgi:hypothetical protein